MKLKKSDKQIDINLLKVGVEFGSFFQNFRVIEWIELTIFLGIFMTLKCVGILEFDSGIGSTIISMIVLMGKVGLSTWILRHIRSTTNICGDYF